ncbi:hypothetical protein [Salsuginibacillus kocurii]|uniref:NHL domain-containing protein n=1 Tax=Salsuginibacillus kocurii TaxID=427078 RepID=UPI0003803713|nr:hypothetical protein [Salsuginibacillus kocurii]
MSKKQQVWLLASCFMVLTACTNDDTKEDVSLTVFDSDVAELFGEVQIEMTIGDEKEGYEEGSKEEAEFTMPAGMTHADEHGVLIADTGNNAVRSLDEEGVVTTFAGGEAENAEGTFVNPHDVTYEPETETVYIADTGNGAIKTVENGEVNTVLEGLERPSGITTGPNSEVYISETGNHRIIKLEDNNEFTVVAGDYEEEDYLRSGGLEDGIGEEARFREPYGLTVDDEGTIYVADSGNQRIRTISPAGEVDTLAGAGEELMEDSDYIEPGAEDGEADEAAFNFPRDVQLMADELLFVADTYNHAVRVVDLNNGYVEAWLGFEAHTESKVEENAQIEGPYGLVFDEEDLLISDFWNNNIRRVTSKNE